MAVVEPLLALALLVLVPSLPGLHPARARHVAVSVLAAASATAGLLLSPGTAAAATTLPWLLLATVRAATLTRRWMQRPSATDRFVRALAGGYLVVGAAWLTFHAADAQVAGVAPPFVLLTAVHFHYAGTVSLVLACCAWQRWRSRPSAAAVALVASGPPVVALGFLTIGLLQIVGAVQLTVGLWTLAAVTLSRLRQAAADRVTAALLVTSSLAVLVPMLLAVVWASGWNLGTPAPTIPQMAWSHGVLNALGFALPGVLGWRRLLRHPDRGGTG